MVFGSFLNFFILVCGYEINTLIVKKQIILIFIMILNKTSSVKLLCKFAHLIAHLLYSIDTI